MSRVYLVVLYLLFITSIALAARTCPVCGAEWPDDYNFCKNDGTALVPLVTCPTCGAIYPKGTAACSACGYVFLKPKAVTVTADPKQADIYIGGVKMGRGKVSFALAAGATAVVEAKLKGYSVDSETVGYDYAPSVVTLKLSKVTTVPSPAKRRTGASFLDGNWLLWSSVGVTAACFGAGYYNELKAGAAAEAGSAASNEDTIAFYRAEVSKRERLRNGFYIAGTAVGCGAAYLGSRKLFFTVTPVPAGIGMNVAFWF